MRYRRQSEETDVDDTRNSSSMEVRKENGHKCGGGGYLVPENEEVAT